MFHFGTPVCRPIVQKGLCAGYLLGDFAQPDLRLEPRGILRDCINSDDLIQPQSDALKVVFSSATWF